MNTQLVIFDLDGTILNTIDDLADSANVILQIYGFPTHTVEEIKYMVGNGIPKLVERMIPDGLKNPDYEQVLSDYIKFYNDNCAIKTAPYDGIIETINQLRQAGVKVAVNTNKVQKAADELCAQYFPGVFDFISGGAKDIPHKPAPDGVNRILEKTGFKPSDCVFIGDSDVDIMTGKNSGMDAIGVAWGFRGRQFLKEHGARVIIDEPRELIDLFNME